MPNARSADKAPVTVFAPREVLADAREHLATDGRTMTDLVGHALREYVAGRLTLPPAPQA